MGYKHAPALDRYADKIALTESGCVEWIASINGSGYGTFGAGGGRTVMAHRWSYEYHVGPISDGLDLDHLCRNRKCVNPAHLEPVTTRTNLLRGVGVGCANAKKTHCPKGHPYSGDNLYVPPGRSNRACRSCRRKETKPLKGTAA